MVLMVEHDLPAQPAHKLTDPRSAENTLVAHRRLSISAEIPLILETLRHCAAAFGTDRARFVRQLPGGEWTVHTLQHDAIISHSADRAEIAMAWTVGLSRFPMRVTRPRVTEPDGSGIRPIAVTSYLGIPILCCDQFVGVIELAGTVKGDLERTLDVLGVELTRFGYRLTHDPSIRAEPHIDLDVECRLDGGFWSPNELKLSDDEWTLLAVMGAPASLNNIVPQVPLSEERVMASTRSLASHGLVTVRAETRALTGGESGRFQADLP